MPTLITSQHNPRIKAIARLAKRSERDQHRLTMVEGSREVSRALTCGIVPTEAYVCPSLATGDEAQQAIQALHQLESEGATHLFEVTPEVFARLVYREESGGLLLVIPYLRRTLADLSPGERPFVAVLEGVEKPGNLGAILRTADAAGVDAVIVCSAAGQRPTDIHNPNVIRASLGTLFSVPVVEESSDAVLFWLNQQQIRIIASSPAATTRYTDVDMTGPVAIVVGSEATGLSEAWLGSADALVTIPMFGAADSLNLATSTALLLYEAVRQRHLCCRPA